MITKNEIKFVKSLLQKKNRYEHNLFIVEGAKSVQEALVSDFLLQTLYATEDFAKENQQLINHNKKLVICKETDLIAMGSFESNNAALAVLKLKEKESSLLHEGLTILLDDISDPGNLGTIIRTADWFGVTNIVCSPKTTDFYSPKVINATMGSFTRVNLQYNDLTKYLSKNTKPVFGAFLDGTTLGKENLPTNAILIIGNEANGISKEVEKFVTHKITIAGAGHTESLNASIATAIILYEFLG